MSRGLENLARRRPCDSKSDQIAQPRRQNAGKRTREPREMQRERQIFRIFVQLAAQSAELAHDGIICCKRQMLYHLTFGFGNEGRTSRGHYYSEDENGSPDKNRQQHGRALARTVFNPYGRFS